MIEDILKKSNFLDKPIVLDERYNPYSKEEVISVLIGVLSSSSNKTPRYFRLYVEGNLINNFESLIILKRVINTKLNDNELKHLFNGKDFLIFINYAGMYSDSLSRISKNFIKNCFDDFDCVIEHNIIIGKYDQTAFGIHIDDAGDRVIHFNVGESEKTFLLYDMESYSTKYGFNDQICEPNIEQEMSKFILKPRDVFTLPGSYYHVARSDNISVSVALAVTKLTSLSKLEYLSSEIKSELSKEVFEDNYRNSFLFNEKYIDKYLESCDLKYYYEQFYKKIMSNNLFIDVIPLQDGLTDIIPNLGRKYILDSNSSIQYFIKNSKLFVFSNGHMSVYLDIKLEDEIYKITNVGHFHIPEALDFKSNSHLLRTWFAKTKVGSYV